jgi:hypothetical protein
MTGLHLTKKAAGASQKYWAKAQAAFLTLLSC